MRPEDCIELRPHICTLKDVKFCWLHLYGCKLALKIATIKVLVLYHFWGDKIEPLFVSA